MNGQDTIPHSPQLVFLTDILQEVWLGAGIVESGGFSANAGFAIS